MGTSRLGTVLSQTGVYDGPRRRRSCPYGAQTRTAAADAASAGPTCADRWVWTAVGGVLAALAAVGRLR